MAKSKAATILAIIMEELNVPKGASLGDIMWALDAIDEDGKIKKMLVTEIRKEVIGEIKWKLAIEKIA